MAGSLPQGSALPFSTSAILGYPKVPGVGRSISGVSRLTGIKKGFCRSIVSGKGNAVFSAGCPMSTAL